MRQLGLPLLIFAAVAAFAGLLWHDSARQGTRASLIGRQAPLDHPLVGAGQPVLINFWFSTCAPCRVEHPVLMELADRGLAILGVNRDVSEEDARAFLAELGNPFAAQLYDPRDTLAEAFDVLAWPTSILVAGNGRIQGVYGPLLDPAAQADMRLITEPESIFEDPAQEAAAQQLFGLINCLDCAANTVRESGGDFALQMRKLVRAWLAEGWEEAQIRDTLVARYGPHIWLDPPLNWTTASLYLLPVLVVVLGGFRLWRQGRRP